MFLWTSNSKSAIFPKMYPSVSQRGGFSTLGYITVQIALYPSVSHRGYFRHWGTWLSKQHIVHCTTSHHVAKSKCFAPTRSWILQCAPLFCTSWVLGRRKYKQATDEMISWKAVGMDNVVGGGYDCLQQNRWYYKMMRCALHRWCSGATFTCEFQSQNRVANLKQDFSHLRKRLP